MSLKNGFSGTVLWGLSRGPFQQAVPRDLFCEPPQCYVQAVAQLRYIQTVVRLRSTRPSGTRVLLDVDLFAEWWYTASQRVLSPAGGLWGDCSLEHLIGTLARGHGWGPISPHPPPAPHCESLEKGPLGTVLWGLPQELFQQAMPRDLFCDANMNLTPEA